MTIKKSKVNKEKLEKILTERGTHLTNAHWGSQGTLKERCKECGCRIRGANHDQGSHHKNRVKSPRA